MTEKSKVGVVGSQNQKARKYRWLFNSCFLVFLFSSLLSRLIPWRSANGHGSTGHNSLIREAKEQAGMFVGFMFTNY